LVADQDGVTALTAAATSGHNAVVECLLGWGADVEARYKAIKITHALDAERAAIMTCTL
jgi:ankyrin repeat protein